MPKPNYIELSRGFRIPILFEDRSIVAIDKPAGWMLVPVSWQRTQFNLQAALISSIAAGHFWARSRNIKFFKYIHRLDAETSGILLFAKSPGAMNTFSELFETRRMEKIYLAVTERAPKQNQWNCRLSLGPDPNEIGRHMATGDGKESETDFRVVGNVGKRWLVEARPYTGRTHQIRVHMAESGCPIIGDELYGNEGVEMALRAVGLAYRDPFTRKPVAIRAETQNFLKSFGLSGVNYRVEFESLPRPAPAKMPTAGEQKGASIAKDRGR